MSRLLFILSLSFIIAFSFSQNNRPASNTEILSLYKNADDLYQQGEALANRADFTEEKEEALNRQALAAFHRVTRSLQPAIDDSIAFHVYFKTGTLQHYFDSLDAAFQSYQKAIQVGNGVIQLADSFLFKPWLFSGSIYYDRNQFDSAMSCYKKAEAITQSYNVRIDGSNRLYNTLGAMYYETGNYEQAGNYFEKAADLLSRSDPFYESLLVNYKINLASTLTQLEKFDRATSIYEEVLPLHINRNEIFHNIGTIKLKQDLPKDALQYFNKVQYNTNKRIRLFTDIGAAWLQLNELDSAETWFQKAINENVKWNGNRRNSPHGLALKYMGDVALAKGHKTSAVLRYQEAILQLDKDFNDLRPAGNPTSFTGVYSYIHLFNTLTAKAAALEKGPAKTTEFQFALDAYQSAFSLADYVERTYDSDEARLFLNKIKYTAHSKPIELALKLYTGTHDPKYLEQAYVFDQRNKASILSLNVQENELRKQANKKDTLFVREAALKSSITRLSLKAAQVTDSSTLNAIHSEIRDAEIALGKIQDAINENPVYREKQSMSRIPSIKNLQELLDKETVLISYHLSDNKLVTLFFSQTLAGSFEHEIHQSFFDDIESFKKLLHQSSYTQRYEGKSIANALYQTLIFPIESDLKNTTRLVIIPDDELNYLPFEALQDNENKYLLERFSIQYQYSTALLEQQHFSHKLSSLLAMAPFASKGYTDSSGNELESLPASADEIKALKGLVMEDNKAGKSSFTRLAPHSGIIHLATHARADNNDPSQSYIAFYPGNNDDYKLYAREIYGMQLDSTGLIILSACETGTGQLVKGEGLMSLSRAFAYAGCPNIIASLWKAEDKTTAFISKRIHHYLGKGFPKDKALQQAKLDLLHSDEIDPRFKSPNYWAHLLLIGQYEPVKKENNNWLWWAGGVFVAGLIYAGVRKQRNR